MPLNMIGIKKVQGGSLEESLLVPGVAFKKTFSYAGFEMQQKSYKNPRIALLNIELELKAEKDNAEVRVDNVEEVLQFCPISTGWRICSRWVLRFGEFPGWWAAAVDTFCPSRTFEHSKSKSTQPRFKDRCATLYLFEINATNIKRFFSSPSVPKDRRCRVGHPLRQAGAHSQVRRQGCPL